jgi:hypothetical protein
MQRKRGGGGEGDVQEDDFLRINEGAVNGAFDQLDEGTAEEAINIAIKQLTGQAFDPMGDAQGLTAQCVTLYGQWPAVQNQSTAIVMSSAHVLDVYRLMMIPAIPITVTTTIGMYTYGLGFDLAQPSAFGTYGTSNGSTFIMWPGASQFVFNDNYFFRMQPGPQAVSIKPEINSTFVNALPYSGSFTVFSDATNSTTNVLSGSVTFANLPSLGGKTLTLLPPNMMQQATDLKSEASNVSVQWGTEAVYGPDWHGEPRPIQFEDTTGVITDYSYQLDDVFNGLVLQPDNYAHYTVANNPVSRQTSAWVSPYITMSLAASWDGPQNATTANSFAGLDISLIDAPSFEFDCVMYMPFPSTALPEAPASLEPVGVIGYLRVVHYYLQVYVDPNTGNQSAIWATTQDNLPVTMIPTSIGSPQFANGAINPSSTSSRAQTANGDAVQTLITHAEVPVGFQWVGTFVQCLNAIASDPGVAVPTTSVATPYGGLSFQLSTCRQISQAGVARGVASDFRVVRFDSLAPGQNICMNGQIQFVGMAKSTVAPYTNRTPRVKRHTKMSQIMQLLKMLYDCPTHPLLKRLYTSPEKAKVLGILGRGLKSATLFMKNLALRTRDSQIVEHAASLFSKKRY